MKQTQTESKDPFLTSVNGQFDQSGNAVRLDESIFKQVMQSISDVSDAVAIIVHSREGHYLESAAAVFNSYKQRNALAIEDSDRINNSIVPVKIVKPSIESLQLHILELLDQKAELHAKRAELDLQLNAEVSLAKLFEEESLTLEKKLANAYNTIPEFLDIDLNSLNDTHRTALSDQTLELSQNTSKKTSEVLALCDSNNSHGRISNGSIATDISTEYNFIESDCCENQSNESINGSIKSKFTDNRSYIDLSKSFLTTENETFSNSQRIQSNHSSHASIKSVFSEEYTPEIEEINSIDINQKSANQVSVDLKPTISSIAIQQYSANLNRAKNILKKKKVMLNNLKNENSIENSNNLFSLLRECALMEKRNGVFADLRPYQRINILQNFLSSEDLHLWLGDKLEDE